ncbi:MAG: hypothetical protein Q9N34_01280 [Aquificota bacterium]|nr:hypothetical protein [Aquificota bacterium]
MSHTTRSLGRGPPAVVERPPGVPDTPLQRELEEELSSFTPEELTNRIRRHLGSEWARPPATPKERDIENYLGRYVGKKFKNTAKRWVQRALRSSKEKLTR